MKCECDIEKLTTAGALFLEGLGIDLTDQHLKDTPQRFARAWAEFFCAGYQEDPAEILNTTFDDECDEMIIVKDIPLYSTCAHHLVPFYGKAHVGYIPDKGRITGLSKLARVVEAFARRLQIQEKLTREIAKQIETTLGSLGVGVVIEAEHFCMVARGIQKPGSITVTSCMLGVMREKPEVRNEFLSIINMRSDI